MFKKTMKFDNLEGEEVEQTFYFNYNKKEIGELIEFGYVAAFKPEDYASRVPLEEQLNILKTPVSESGLSQQENTQRAYDIFQNLILDAYGEKGSDNVTFVKNARTHEYFASHVAFPEMIFEMLENPRLAASFIENCLPPKYIAEAKKDLAKQGIAGPSLADMVEEAERRQADPATRIEPGLDAAIEAGVVDPNSSVTKLAEAMAAGEDVATDEPIKARPPQELTPEDIDEMDDVAFDKLDMRRLAKPALQAAFKRKMQS